ncbi:hypothetical protein H6A66_09000 [Bacteroides caecigallinarum]|uniref:hypothetical protein n=1 Tax=Bacteroides caecigallinarum TaxID=1411144 RepID=UPI0019562381|nr:hypothetical protein [Bacteroides caecigallinarum]MBM6865301.1 hypothetical protein [Bacteroides caecigallinarum]
MRCYPRMVAGMIIPGNDAVRFRTPHYYLSAGVLQMRTIRLETAPRAGVVNGARKHGGRAL